MMSMCVSDNINEAVIILENGPTFSHLAAFNAVGKILTTNCSLADLPATLLGSTGTLHSQYTWPNDTQ